MEERAVIIELLYKKIEGRLSVSEEEWVNEWLNEAEHRAYFLYLQRFYQLQEKSEVSNEAVEEAWKMMQKRMMSNSARSIPRFRRIVAIAAAVILLAGFWQIWESRSYFYGLREGGKETEKAVSICPGQGNVVLQLADGSTYDLKNPVMLNRSGIGQHIRIDSNRLNYLKSHVCSTDSLVYHKLIVPRGGEFQLMLEDGTKVWLNAETSLKYPENFVGDTREVYLEGEAYFEVTRDTLHPFVVHTGIQHLTVLGTGFAVNSYEDNDYLQTTLVEGKVKVEFPGQIYLLNPNEQITYNRNNKQVSRTKVDVREFTAWKDGKYVFSRKRLEDMLNTLSRWYDFQVLYQNDSVKEKLFSGELMRFENFYDILRMIEKSGDVRFSVEGRTVIVSK